MEEINHGVFGLLLDEYSEVSVNEQMVVVLWFVDKSRVVKEQFVGVFHVKETSSLSLKDVIDELSAKNRLNLSKVRGKGYDGDSNMKGEFNGLRSLVLGKTT